MAVMSNRFVYWKPTRPMLQLRRIYFLIHASIYEAGQGDPEFEAKYAEYIRYERKVRRRWVRAMQTMREDEFLVALSPATQRLASEIESVLGPRALIITDNIITEPRLWDELLDAEAKQGLGRDMMSMFWRHGYRWSSEGLVQPVIARGWASRLAKTLGKRGMGYDPASVVTEGWGESFEGCVANYCRHLGTHLGLPRPIELNFKMTVPDAPFLLGATLSERIPLDRSVRLYLWKTLDGSPVAWYHKGMASIGEAPLVSRIGLGSLEVEVRGKRSLYWPARDSRLRWQDGNLEVPIDGDHFVVCKSGDKEQFRQSLVKASIMAMKDVSHCATA